MRRIAHTILGPSIVFVLFLMNYTAREYRRCQRVQTCLGARVSLLVPTDDQPAIAHNVPVAASSSSASASARATTHRNLATDTSRDGRASPTRAESPPVEELFALLSPSATGASSAATAFAGGVRTRTSRIGTEPGWDFGGCATWSSAAEPPQGTAHAASGGTQLARASGAPAFVAASPCRRSKVRAPAAAAPSAASDEASPDS